MSDTSKLGQFLDGDEGRDAIHIAITPVYIGQDSLLPGDHVALSRTEGTLVSLLPAVVVPTVGNPAVGVLDPYHRREGPFPAGQKVYLFLYPGTITGLKHVWTHPSFADTGLPPPSGGGTFTPSTSEAWLRNFCNTHDCASYDSVMAAVREIEAGHNSRTEDRDGDGYRDAGWTFTDYGRDSYITFYGEDAHCILPNAFWDHVANVLGHPVRRARVSQFSCSC